VVAALAVRPARAAPAAPTEGRTAGASSATPTATVVLLRPSHPAPGSAEALVRLRGELIAAGFAVQMTDVPASADLRAAVDRAAARGRADAVIAILGDPARPSAELRIVDRATGKTVARQVPVPDDPTRAAEILSIRALELLRAGLLEVSLAAGDEAKAAPSPGRQAAGAARAPAEAAKRLEQARPGDTVPPGETAGRPAETARPAESARPEQNVSAAPDEEAPGEPRDRAGRGQATPEPGPPPTLPVAITGRANVGSGGASRPTVWPQSRYAVELGAIVLGSFDGMPAAVLPVLRGTVRLSPHFQARLALAGLGTNARVQTTAGDAEATVTQSFGLAEVALAFRTGARMQPFLSLGAGAVHLAVEGRAGRPYEGKTSALWAAIADAGFGVRVGLGRRFQLAAEAHAQGAYPYPVVRFLDTTLAEEGRPTLLGGLSLMAWL